MLRNPFRNGAKESEHPYSVQSHDSIADIRLAFFLNLTFTVIELIGGVLTNSTAIIADAVHDLGDSIALGQAWYFERLVKNSGSRRYTYGYRRFTLLGALISIGVLLFSSLYILTATIPRLLAPETAHAPGMIILALLGVSVNGYVAVKLVGSTGVNAQVVALHLLEDTLGWIAILVVAVVLLFRDLPILDPILAILITIYILYSVVQNLKKTMGLFLQAAPESIDLDAFIDEISTLDSVDRVHHVHAWSLDGERHVLTAHLVVKKPLSAEEYESIKLRVREAVEEYGFSHSTIEIEWPDEICRIASSGCY